jgi:two-component sensor histidine kinase
VVSWSVTAKGRLLLDWVESGGPVVKPPKRNGFGTGFIRRSIETELGGTIAFHFLPGGLAVHAEIPLGVYERLGSLAREDGSQSLLD